MKGFKLVERGLNENFGLIMVTGATTIIGSPLL